MTNLADIPISHDTIAIICSGPSSRDMSPDVFASLKAQTYTIAINWALADTDYSPHLRCITDRSEFAPLKERANQDSLAGYIGNLNGRAHPLPKEFDVYYQKEQTQPYFTLAMVLRIIAQKKDRQIWLIGVDYTEDTSKHCAKPMNSQAAGDWLNFLKDSKERIKDIFENDKSLYERCWNGNPDNGLSFMKSMDYKLILKGAQNG